MSWTDSLIRIRNFEIEELRKRMMAIQARRAALEDGIKALDAEAVREIAHARDNAEAGWYLIGFREGIKQRRAQIDTALRTLAAEETGARDALSLAFEDLKKVEKAAEGIAAQKAKVIAHKEAQALDEQALRRQRLAS